MRSYDPMTPRIWQVESMERENHDTYTIVLRSLSGEKFDSQPGQFNMLYAHGVGEVAISISGDTSNHDTITHTIRAVGAGTLALEKLGAGDSIGVRGPFGTAWPTGTLIDKDVIIIVGGIGLAPLRPVIYHLASLDNDRNEKNLKTTMIYGARSPEDRIFIDELKQWSKLPGWDIISTVDKQASNWDGCIGHVTDYFPTNLENPANTILLSCGPEIMMSSAAEKMKELGIPEDNIYLSMERNMNCGIGLCGHCQTGPYFICKDGPVFSYPSIQHLIGIKEI